MYDIPPPVRPAAPWLTERCGTNQRLYGTTSTETVQPMAARSSSTPFGGAKNAAKLFQIAPASTHKLVLP